MNLSKIVNQSVSAIQNLEPTRDLFYAFVVILVAYIVIVFGRDKSRAY